MTGQQRIKQGVRWIAWLSISWSLLWFAGLNYLALLVAAPLIITGIGLLKERAWARRLWTGMMPLYTMIGGVSVVGLSYAGKLGVMMPWLRFISLPYGLSFALLMIMPGLLALIGVRFLNQPAVRDLFH